MKYRAAIILPIFLFVAIFGFALMCEHTLATHHSAMEGGAAPGCFLGIIGDCGTTGTSMALQHISAYQAFFNAQISVFSLSFLLLFLTIVFAWIYLQNLLLSTRSLAFAYTEHNSDLRSLRKEKLLKWISLFENSPSSR